MNTQVLEKGMSDSELESACVPQLGDGASWSSWTSEVYSLGKCFRHLTHYPRVLPLFISSDHGVGLHSSLMEHELIDYNLVHFTWSLEKAKRSAANPNKRVVHVKHPWISYRRSVGKARVEHTIGTIVFFAHHVPGT